MTKTKVRQENSNRHPHRSRRGKAETREELMSAAMELFARKGYRGTSVRDVASRAGVTTGAFYSNFRSKRDIYVAIINKIATTLEDIVDEIARENVELLKKKGVHAEYELFRAPIIRLLEEGRRHNALLHIIRRETLGRDPEFQREFDRIFEKFVDVTRRALDLYIEAGLAKAYDTSLVARSIVPMFVSLSLYDVRTKGKYRQDIVSLVASFLYGGASKWVSWRKLEYELYDSAES